MLYCRWRVKQNEAGKEGKQIQGILAKLVTRKHTAVACLVNSFLNRLLGNIYLGTVLSVQEKNLSAGPSCLLPVFGQNLDHKELAPSPFWVVLAPLGICWEVKPRAYIAPQHSAESGAKCDGRSQNLHASDWLGLGLKTPSPQPLGKCSRDHAQACPYFLKNFIY